MGRALLRCVLVVGVMSVVGCRPVPVSGVQGGGDLRTDVAAVIRAGQDDAEKALRGGSYWSMPAYLGTHFVAQYALFLDWFEWAPTRLDRSRLKAKIIDTQLDDGSWYAIRSTSPAEGDLNATISNYWFLKAMGEKPESARMNKARQWILARGGIERSAMLTKVVLALFGNYPWSRLPQVPYSLFSDVLPVKSSDFAQWVTPHLVPYAYLRGMEVAKDLGAAYRVDELWAPGDIPKGAWWPRVRLDVVRAQLPNTRMLMSRVLRDQQPLGTWGAYTVSTLWTMAALESYRTLVPSWRDDIDRAFRPAAAIMDRFYCVDDGGQYNGVLMDGRYWDTILVGMGMVESGADVTRLKDVGGYLSAQRAPGGGIPYGQDFGYAPDTDDTALAIVLFKRLGGFEAQAKRATEWLLSMQNSNGGWGAFARNNEGNLFLKFMAKDFLDSADLFDEAESDVTGHILEALGEQGYTVSGSKPVARAVEFLRSRMDPEVPGWAGRWGINYLYGTPAVLVGLLKVGVARNDPMVDRPLRWMIGRQNADGGFGESSASYHDKRQAGVGPSTASQTAWVLLAMVEAGMRDTPEAERAVRFLVDQHRRHKRFVDPIAVGTGHPGIIYMEYPAYPYSFPLMALGRWQKR